MAEREPRELIVATQPTVGAVEIRMTDSGPGTASEVAGRMFQPFVATQAAGLGLGLSICREIVETHGGQLTASPGATCGTVFTVRLPVAE